MTTVINIPTNTTTVIDQIVTEMWSFLLLQNNSFFLLQDGGKIKTGRGSIIEVTNQAIS